MEERSMIDKLARVEFDVDSDKVEIMHAKERGDGLFTLDNSPFYAFNISCGDVFSAVDLASRGLVFAKIVERGGHSTYRVRLRAGEGHQFFLQRWPAMAALGCSYEGSGLADRRLYSIDIPVVAAVPDVYALLERGEEEEVWEFEEAHYFRPEGDQ
jgi:hypothetical protein